MIRTPAHKQTDPTKTPGVVKGFDRYPYMKHSTADKTLGDYLLNKYPELQNDQGFQELINSPAADKIAPEYEDD